MVMRPSASGATGDFSPVWEEGVASRAASAAGLPSARDCATDDPKEASIKVRRAVTIKGQVVGPDGKPVKDAVVFFPSELRPEEPFGIAQVS